MTDRQLSEHIGNIDDRLIERSERVPNFGAARRGRIARRIVSAAAALAVMVGGGFGLGATVFAQEVEVQVEVPVEPETVTLEDFGITLILPDSWKGNYAVEKDEINGYNIYIPSIRGDQGRGNGGILCYVKLWDEQITQEEHDNIDGQWNYALNRYIMTTKDGTLLLYYASDVQVDPFNEEEIELYDRMESEISQIRFVVDNALGE